MTNEVCMYVCMYLFLVIVESAICPREQRNSESNSCTKSKQAWAALYVQYGTSSFVRNTCENLPNACVGIFQRATHRSRIERKHTEPGRL